MKKYLIVLAAAVVALASCKPGGESGSKYTKISFKQTELTWALGATDKLVVLDEPITLEAPAVTWATSDAEVVVVDQNGNIGAAGIGEANITATYGEGESALQAVCKVTVMDPLDNLQWGGWSLWNFDRSTILSTDTIKKTLQSGQEVSCVMIPATYKIWSDGLYLDVDHLAGAGYVADLEGTALLITDDLGKGPNYFYLGVNRLDIVPADKMNWNDTTYANCAITGALGSADAHMAWLQDTTETLEPAFTGRIWGVDFNAEEFIDPFAGLIGQGVFVGDETATLYKSYVSWFQEPQSWGLVVEAVVDPETGETTGYKFKEPYEWAPLKEAKYYELLQLEEEAPKAYTVKEFVAKKENKIARPDVLTHK